MPTTATLTATAKVSGASNKDVEQGVNAKGVQVRWMIYRGPGKVQFSPAASDPSKENPVTAETKVTFGAPGTYRIRALATDGAIVSTYDVDVTVKPGPGAFHLSRTARRELIGPRLRCRVARGGDHRGGDGVRQ